MSDEPQPKDPPSDRIGTSAIDGLRYAGFWTRALAFIIDIIVLLPVNALILILVIDLGSVAANFFFSFFDLLYFVLLTSSAWQGTIGKRVLRIRVISTEGRRLSLGRALGRWLASLVSAWILLIGLMMAGWTREKKALHDIICRTRVVHDPEPVAGRAQSEYGVTLERLFAREAAAGTSWRNEARNVPKVGFRVWQILVLFAAVSVLVMAATKFVSLTAFIGGIFHWKLADEAIAVMAAIAVFAGLPLAAMCGGHFAVRLIDRYLGTRILRLKQAYIDLLGGLALSVFAWRLWDAGSRAGPDDMITMMLKVPFAPVAYYAGMMSAASAVIFLWLGVRRLRARVPDGDLPGGV